MKKLTIFKRIVAVCISSVLLFSTAITASAADLQQVTIQEETQAQQQEIQARAAGLPYTDVPDSGWIYDAAKYMYDHNIMTGMTPTTFEPETIMSRAHFATILYRMEGEPAVNYSPVFPDVPEGEFYSKPVMWANQNGIITGYDQGNFGPSDIITKEQMVTIMYRYANYKGVDTSLKLPVSNFLDGSSVSGFSMDAVSWALANEIITGENGQPIINPQGEASRAIGATIVMRYLAPSTIMMETTASLSYLSNNNWYSFDRGTTAYPIDGFKIETDPNKPYYFSYRTLNEGKTSFYPRVTSTGGDYAGYPGRRIQLLDIEAKGSTSGTNLVAGVVIMYRVHTADTGWLPWVSNANPDWMERVQKKFNLPGSLDTGGDNAGIEGKNINGIDIRIYEETRPKLPSSNSKVIQAPFISQLGTYPTGCESVSTVMALNYAGINMSVDTFIDNYLYKTGWPFDPNESFGGDPRSSHGYGCYAPVIKKALDQILAGTGYSARILNNVPLKDLCIQYIDNNIPVILWASMDMQPPKLGNSWVYNGKTIQWMTPEHCLLMVGYDDGGYIFNDPLRRQPQTYYGKAMVETAYRGMYSQAIVIVKDGTRMESEPAPDFEEPMAPESSAPETTPSMPSEGNPPSQDSSQASSQPAESTPPQESEPVESTPSEGPPEGNTSSEPETSQPEESSSTPEESSSSSTDSSEGPTQTESSQS